MVSDQGPMTKETSNKKNWKGKVAKQWKRMHAGSSPAQNTSYPEGGSIGMLIVQFMHTYVSLVFWFLFYLQEQCSFFYS